MAGVKGRSGRRPGALKRQGTVSPTITLSGIQELRRMLWGHICKELPTLRGQRRLILIHRLIDVAYWYEAGVTFRSSTRTGRRPAAATQIFLSDCAAALHVATGRVVKLWQRDTDEEGTPESEAVRLARIVASVIGKPLPRNLRRQIAASRTIC